MNVHTIVVPRGRKVSLRSVNKERVIVLSQGSVVVQSGVEKSKFCAPAHFIIPAHEGVDILTLEDIIWYGIDHQDQQNVAVVELNQEASTIEHFFTEGVYARKMEIRAGTQVPTHKHVYDHLSILAKGRVRVAVGLVIQEYVAPAMIEIKKDIAHKITALEDSVWFCVHATTATDIESLEQTVILKE